MAMPAAQGLYDPNNEHDACGVSFAMSQPSIPGTEPARTNANTKANTAKPSTTAAGAIEIPKISGLSLETLMDDAQQ